MGNANSEGLINRLAELTKVYPLSELHYINYNKIRKHLPDIKPEEYSLFQWLDAAEYLTGTKLEGKTEQEIHDYLLHYHRPTKLSLLKQADNGLPEDRKQ